MNPSTNPSPGSPSAPTERSPGRPADPALDRALIDAATSVLVEVGYAKLTTAAVARRAGASTASLYRRWASKHDLVRAAAATLAAEAVATATFDTGTLRGDLRALFEHKQELLSGDVGVALLTLLGHAAHDPELAAILRAEVLVRTEEQVSLALDRSRARGESGDLDPHAYATLLVLGAVAPLLGYGDAGAYADLFARMA